jgi:hypothetical protein
MSAIPTGLAFCPTHGIVNTGVFEISGGGIIISSDNTARCPAAGCGQVCRMLPGTYTGNANRIILKLDKSVSPDALVALQKLAAQLRLGEVSLAEAENAATKIHRGLAELFSLQNIAGDLRAAIIAVAIQSFIHSCQPHQRPPSTGPIIVGPILIQEVEAPTSMDVIIERAVANIAPRSDLSTPPTPRVKPRASD